MRITNSMIRNNTSNNMSTNKGYVDTLNTQMSTQKKIDRPSDDPVIAIRALRLRSSLSEINQYYEKNIPDAESWLEVTETALKNMESILTDVYRQCVNGATDHLNESDRNTILTNLQKLREQVYAEGNADYAGRTVFTGYKTNKSLTFGEDTSDTSYNITQKLEFEDITQKTYYSGLSSVPTTDDLTAGNLPAGNVEDHTYSRVRLAYDNIDNITQLQYKDANGNLQDIEGMEITYLDADGNTQTATVSYNVHNYTDWQNAQNLNVGDNEVIFVKETGELIIVDPADCPEKIEMKISRMNGKPVAILLTHGHFDHILAAQAVKEKYNIPIYACRQEEEMLREPSINMTVHYGQGCSIVPDVFLEDLDVIRLAGFSVQMIHTPGHTKGSCCYYLKDEGVLFSGDTVFYGSVGRTDFPGGSTAEIVRSLHKLVDSLPEETEVFPGHDASTTIGYEKRYNPFV